MEIESLQKKAERLAELRDAIKKEEDAVKEKVEPLKTERDMLQEELLADMHKEKVASLRVENGDMYTRAVRKGIQITNEVFARTWAKEHNAFSVDRRLVAQQLKDAEEMPSGFDRVETPYISIRKSK